MPITFTAAFKMQFYIEVNRQVPANYSPKPAGQVGKLRAVLTSS